MAKPFLIIFSFLILHLSLAQNRQAQIWKYGQNFGNTLDFGFSPVKRIKANVAFDLGVASICDSNGNFLFSGRNGILNRKDSLMPNGDLQPKYGSALLGCYLIIPYQSDKMKYHYLMVSSTRNTTSTNPPYFIYDLTVDMRLHGSLGDVDTTKTQIIDSLVDLQISCMLHANGRDSWLIGRGYNSDSLFAYQITDSGVVKKVISDINSPVKKANLDYGAVIGSRYDSQLKSSPDSKLLLIPRRMKEYPFSELLQFDRETGQFSNKIIIADTTGNFFITNYGDGCFSPDSRQLYYSIGTKTSISTSGEGPGHFWQFDLSNYDSVSINQSKIFLGRLGRRVPTVPELRPWAPKMQLAMDGKIYVSPGIRTDKYMSTIRCPNKRGKDCGLEFRTIDLGDGKNGAYFPTLNQTFVRNAGIFQLQANKRTLCQGDTLELSGYGAGAEKFRWSVSPALPQTIKVDTLTWQKIDTRNIAPGAYTFSCQSSSSCGDQYEKSITVTINPKPEPPGLPPGRRGVSTPCLGDSAFLFVPNPVSGHRYFWSTGRVDSQIVVKQTGKYSLDSVSNSFGCGLKIRDTVSVVIKDFLKPGVPVLVSPKLNEICQGQKIKLTVKSGQLIVLWSTGQKGDSIEVVGGQEFESGKKFWAFCQTFEGCISSASDTFLVRLKTIPAPVVVSPKVNEVCVGEKAKLIVDSGKLTVWNTGQTGDSITVDGSQDLGIGKKYWAFSQSSEGCVSSVSDTILVKEIPNPEPRFLFIDTVLRKESLQNQNYCVQGQAGSKFSFVVQGGTVVDSSEDCITINWSPISIVNYPLSIKAIETLANPCCIGVVSQQFVYRPSLEIPSLVTPNGDGKNDTFIMEDLQFYASHRLQIFDRWGKKVLDSSAYKNDWQGEEGIYFYSLLVDGKVFSDWVMVGK